MRIIPGEVAREILADVRSHPIFYGRTRTEDFGDLISPPIRVGGVSD